MNLRSVLNRIRDNFSTPPGTGLPFFFVGRMFLSNYSDGNNKKIFSIFLKAPFGAF